jgi:hypothetical protein
MRAIRIKIAIISLVKDPHTRNLALVALASGLREEASNLSNGPEVYVSRRRLDADVVRIWEKRVEVMLQDVSSVQEAKRNVSSQVFDVDARFCAEAPEHVGTFDVVVTSPPYPVEHDYTRNFRLEMAICGYLDNETALQKIKKRMIRSHSKGVYKEDTDKDLVIGNTDVQEIVHQLQLRGKERKDGFARQYPKVVGEYFGGLARHLRSMAPLLRPGASCFYVLGDEQSFLDVPIQTAHVFASVIKSCSLPFVVEEISNIKYRRSSTRRRELSENVMLLKVAH